MYGTMVKSCASIPEKIYRKTQAHRPKTNFRTYSGTMKLQLIDDWRKAWKWFSLHAMVLAAAVQGVWLEIPVDMKDKLPEQYVHYVTIALMVLGIVGRLVKQGKDENV